MLLAAASCRLIGGTDDLVVNAEPATQTSAGGAGTGAGGDASTTTTTGQGGEAQACDATICADGDNDCVTCSCNGPVCICEDEPTGATTCDNDGTPGYCFDGVCVDCIDNDIYDCFDANANCKSQVCEASTCTDGLKGVTESDVDCGGTCAPCGPSGICNVSSDCTTNLCVGTCATCMAHSDCGSGRFCEGGACLNKKGLGGSCSQDYHCNSNNCYGFWCVP
jgi:hypothetical protein